MLKEQREYGSFRDPDGFIFYRNGEIYRAVSPSYRKDYELLLGSGLYDTLVKKGYLVAHEECSGEEVVAESYKTIRPEMIEFISYPYEWSFSQLKEAALLTLRIQKTALDHGMSLKDASAFNVQFRGPRPVLIDTLSFEEYKTDRPWPAYRQFCRHFLAPLALMVYRDPGLIRMLQLHIDGLPLDLTSELLPRRTRFRLSLYSHIHLHARAEKKYSDRAVKDRVRLKKTYLYGLIAGLERAVERLQWKPEKTEWSDYYSDTNYSVQAFEEKKNIVRSFVERFQPRTLWDLGANTGEFSRACVENGRKIVSFDGDHAAVEKNFLECHPVKEHRDILPLVLDLTNPSPDIGWLNQERRSLIARGPADLGLALALVHHLAIVNNLPFSLIADFFQRCCRNLIIEFVPKTDSQIQRMLLNREDIFSDYNQQAFEEAFSRSFRILETKRLPQSDRVLYAMENRNSNDGNSASR